MAVSGAAIAAGIVSTGVPVAAGAPLPLDVPVQPTPPEAVELLIEELAKPEYQAARPTPLDLLAKAIADWFSSLFSVGGVALPPGVVIAVIAGVVVVAIVVLLLVFGVPHRNRRSAAAGELFGDDDRRDAAQLRSDAAAAAARGDWVTAIADRFRALARAIGDRELVAVLPGTTAREFAAGAAVAFPAEVGPLAAASTTFDRVRYLSEPGDEAGYAAIVALDDRIAATRPVLAPTEATPAAASERAR